MKRLIPLVIALCLAAKASAQAPKSSDYVAISLPTALLIGKAGEASGVPQYHLPSGMLSTVATLSVIATYEEGDGFSWLLERPSDGARFSLRIAGRLLEGALLVPGAVVSITACSAGALVSSSGRVLALIPSDAGKALLHDERVSD